MSNSDSSTGRRPSRISPTTYGGQAVLEGVMMRGRRWAAVAVRAPSQRIVVRSERLPVPSVRRLGQPNAVCARPDRALGLAWVGMKALMFSAEVAEQGEEAEQTAGAQTSRLQSGDRSALTTAWWPSASSSCCHSASPGCLNWPCRTRSSSISSRGIVRLALLVGYVWAIGYVPGHQAGLRVPRRRAHDDPRLRGRRPAGPGAHRQILAGPPALRHGVPAAGGGHLDRAVRAGPDDTDWWVRIASRILAIPVIAGIAYEILKFGGAHAEHPLMQLIVAPGLALQALTTRYPEPGMIEVAVASFEEMRRREAESEVAQRRSSTAAPPLS